MGTNKAGRTSQREMERRVRALMERRAAEFNISYEAACEMFRDDAVTLRAHLIGSKKKGK